jgi:hypothetical protein
MIRTVMVKLAFRWSRADQGDKVRAITPGLEWDVMGHSRGPWASSEPLAQSGDGQDDPHASASSPSIQGELTGPIGQSVIMFVAPLASACCGSPPGGDGPAGRAVAVRVYRAAPAMNNATK